LRLHAAAQAVRAADVAREGLEGPALGEALEKARIRAIGAARATGRADHDPDRLVP